nr:sulfotransferase domain-containing protein [Pseudosulfitobacter sp. DSM 107133]
MGKTQQGGTLIKRPSAELFSTSVTPLAKIFALDDTHFIHCHLIHRPQLAERLKAHRHLFILRHPRNIAVSWMRHRIKQNPELEASSEYLENVIRGGMFAHSVPDFIAMHLPWQRDESTLTVRFEDLVARDMPTLEAIAAYVGGEPDPLHYDNAFGSGSTFMGTFSTWAENPLWNDAVEKAWVETGGPKVEADAGY